MRKIIVLSVLIFVCSPVYSQNPDSLFNSFVNFRTKSVIGDKPALEGHEEIIKCGFPMLAAVRLNYEKFTPSQQSILNSLLDRPSTDTSIVSPRGLFRIHYDLTGDHKPNYSMIQLGEALDSAYNYEVNVLGYPSPPSDNGTGGDNLYDVYIQNLGSNYGGTVNENSIGGSKWTSFIEMDNDFKDFYTTGIEAARVTAAHEFHHMIQMGCYKLDFGDSFYYEITSTAMEEIVFDEINDYYGYMRSYFNNPDVCLSKSPGYGYDLAIWNLYLKDRFGVDIIKKIWEYMVDHRALEAIDLAISSVQSEATNFKNELNKFGVWTYFTGPRAEFGKEINQAFEEGEHYPLIKPTSVIEFQPPVQSMMVLSEALSNNFLVYYDFSESLPDTLVCLITNGNVTGGLKTTPVATQFNYSVRNDQPTGYKKVTDKYFSLLESSNAGLFQEANIFNYTVIEGDFNREEIDYTFPSPFIYSQHSILNVPVVPDPNGIAQLQIYTPSMKLVYSGRKNIIAGEKVVVRWDGFDDSGNKLPTGVYIYVTEAGDKITKGKLVIYNE